MSVIRAVELMTKLHEFVWYDHGVMLTFTLNGDPYELDSPVTISTLLARLEIDARQVAVELNLEVVKKVAYESSVVNHGDTVEIVNFVGGG